ncbi:MAG: hypothetical protein KF768_09040 [Phycisphaeraceae bacterium]|nr:hypothetical protein [Phycisphaeraceae bacterium]
MLTQIGLSRARLVIRQADEHGTVVCDKLTGGRLSPRVDRSIEGVEAEKLVRILRRLAELVEVAERRGVKFPDLLSARSGDPSGNRKLPTHRLTWTGAGGESYAWSEQQARQIAKERKLVIAEVEEDSDDAPLGPTDDGAEASKPLIGSNIAILRELHENRELERVFEQLTAFGIDIVDFALVQEESVTGERLPTRFAWELTAAATGGSGSVADSANSTPDTDRSHEEASADSGTDSEDHDGAPTGAAAASASGPASRVVEVPGVSGILPALHDVGRRGLEIKRFKGLGEMDAEQLWETTMDASRRVLLRVTWDGAAEADTLFSILMGEQVEARRKFIEDHALEVKNLDV